MKRIRVNLGSRSYPIFVGNNVIKQLHTIIPAAARRGPFVIVTNKKVRRLAGAAVVSSLKRTGLRVSVFQVPDSERAKSFKTYHRIVSELVSIGKRVRPTVVALGGGVVGDVAGFAASTYRRGVPLIQIPTTLLAQVDSSIGGKVAVDLPKAKNIVGSFYQPTCVISDTAVLSSLPIKEVRNGLAEVIKYGIICDKKFFAYLERMMPRIVKLDPGCIRSVVVHCARFKARVVEQDEYDARGIRMILNFGHTFAHAIETTFAYTKRCTHGEAVGIGMMLATQTAQALGMVAQGVADRVHDILSSAKLPVAIPPVFCEQIVDAIQYDKKFTTGANRFVLPTQVGKARIITDVPETAIRTVLRKGGKR